jgi:hypothetical protein
MSREFNGVIVFEAGEKDDDHPALKALSKVSLGDVRFPFGFYLTEEGGKTVVIPATEQEHRNTLRKAFPDKPDPPTPCGFTGQEGCRGGPPCPLLQFPGVGGGTAICKKLHDPATHFFGCACFDPT